MCVWVEDADKLEFNSKELNIVFADYRHDTCVYPFVVVLRTFDLFLEVCDLLVHYDSLSEYRCARPR